MTPSHMTSLGDVMSVEKRISVLSEAISHNRLIIEDDYNNEFRYFSKPRPCLQGLAGGEHVVYLSTFSKLLQVWHFYLLQGNFGSVPALYEYASRPRHSTFWHEKQSMIHILK